MAPGYPTKLGAKVKDKNRKLEDTNIPVCVVNKGVTLDIPMLPTPTSQGLRAFSGWGVVPLLLMTSEQAEKPTSEQIRKELFTFLRGCKGPNNVGKIATYYDETSGKE